MKNTLRHVLLLVAAFVATAGVSRAQQKISVAHSATPDVAVRFVGEIAKMRVVGWKFDSLAIVGFIPKGAHLESYLGDASSAPTRGAKMYMENADSMAPPGGQLELRVPMGARVTVNAGTADVEVTGMTGEVTVNVLGGTVHVTGSPRILNVEAIDATLTVDGSPAWVRLKSGEGDLVMHGSTADGGFRTVSGNIRMSDGALERASFETVTGSVTLAGDIARAGDVKVDTHSGAVDVLLDVNASVLIDALSTRGTIENMVSKRAPDKTRDGGQTVSTEVMKGGSHIVITTYKGHIKLARR